jgi:hypothetical protein
MKWLEPLIYIGVLGFIGGWAGMATSGGYGGSSFYWRLERTSTRYPMGR